MNSITELIEKWRDFLADVPSYQLNQYELGQRRGHRTCALELEKFFTHSGPPNKPNKPDPSPSDDVECGICGKDHFDFECPDK